MSDEKLLPCPFCGCEAAFNSVKYSAEAVAYQHWDQDTFHGVNCIECGVSNTSIRGYDTQAEAAEAWNKRAPITIGFHSGD